MDGASQQSLEEWTSTLAKGGGAKRRFQYCVNPNSSNQFLYLRAIQGHPEENAIDPTLQDNVLLPKGFTEFIFHVGNASELNSIIRNGLIPAGKSVKRGRQALFFTAVNPMEDGNGLEATPRDRTKSRFAPYKSTWKRFQNTVYWCNLKLAHEKGLHFYQTRSHAVVLHNLWILEELRGQRLQPIRVQGTENATDVATKHFDAATLQKCMVTIG